MATKKGASSTRNGRDSNAQRLGVKRFGGKEAGESSQEAPASQDATTAGTPAASAPGSEDEAAPAEVGTPRDEA